LRKKLSIANALEEGLAKENRRVLSSWRALVILRRATKRTPSHKRRWARSPTPGSIKSILRRLAENGELEALPNLPQLYRITSPYAQTPIQEDEILLELHPYAALSFLSAFVFHNMINDLPKELHVTIPEQGSGGMIPTGTSPDDWFGLDTVPGRMVDKINKVPIHWHKLTSARIFGQMEYSPLGYPIRVTTPERTLLDGLLHPEWCGGMSNILRAWANYKDLINLNALAELVDQFHVTVLCQRVGFILEELSLSHPSMEAWLSKSHRGGSSKLAGNLPFAPTFSKRWMLSINTPVDALHSEEK